MHHIYLSILCLRLLLNCLPAKATAESNLGNAQVPKLTPASLEESKVLLRTLSICDNHKKYKHIRSTPKPESIYIKALNLGNAVPKLTPESVEESKVFLQTLNYCDNHKESKYAPSPSNLEGYRMYVKTIDYWLKDEEAKRLTTLPEYWGLCRQAVYPVKRPRHFFAHVSANNPKTAKQNTRTQAEQENDNISPSSIENKISTCKQNGSYDRAMSKENRTIDDTTK